MFSRFLLVLFPFLAAGAVPASPRPGPLLGQERGQEAFSAADVVPAATWTENILPGVGLEGLLAMGPVSRDLRTLAHERISSRYRWSRQRALRLLRTILDKLPHIAKDQLLEFDAVAVDAIEARRRDVAFSANRSPHEDLADRTFKKTLAQLVRDVDPDSLVFAESVTGSFETNVRWMERWTWGGTWTVVVDLEGSPGVARRRGRTLLTEEERPEEDSDLFSPVTEEDVSELVEYNCLLDEANSPFRLEKVAKVFIKLFVNPIPLDGRPLDLDFISERMRMRVCVGVDERGARWMGARSGLKKSEMC